MSEAQFRQDVPIEIGAFISRIDGSVLVQIDTTDETGNLRVVINDSEYPVYDGDVEKDEPASYVLAQIATKAAEPRRTVQETEAFFHWLSDLLFANDIEPIGATS